MPWYDEKPWQGASWDWEPQQPVAVERAPGPERTYFPDFPEPGFNPEAPLEAPRATSFALSWEPVDRAVDRAFDYGTTLSGLAHAANPAIYSDLVENAHRTLRDIDEWAQLGQRARQGWQAGRDVFFEHGFNPTASESWSSMRQNAQQGLLDYFTWPYKLAAQQGISPLDALNYVSDPAYRELVESGWRL